MLTRRTRLVDPQSPVAERLQHLPLRADLQPLGGQDVVGVEVERLGGGHAAGSSWRTAPAATLRGLANGSFPSASNRSLSLSNSAVHDHLAADGEKWRDRPLVAAQAQGDAGDRAHVGGDPLAAPAVAAGDGVLEQAVAVDQLDREAVELGLHGILDGHGVPAAQPFAQPLVEPAERRLVLVRVQGEHGRRVLDGREAGQRLAGDPLGGGVFVDQVGECSSSATSSWIELVVRRVGDPGLVLDIVEDSRDGGSPTRSLAIRSWAFLRDPGGLSSAGRC